MAPGGPPAKRKRPERSYSGDTNADQPPAKSPRGSRYHNNVQANSHPQGQNRDNVQRGGRGGNRGGRVMNNVTNTLRRPPQNSDSASNAPATSTTTPMLGVEPSPKQPAPQTVPQPQVTKEQDALLEDTPQDDSEPRPPRHYQEINDELVEKWQESGRQTAVELARNAWRMQDHVHLGCIFQELLFSGLDARIDPKEVGDTIRRVISESSTSGNPQPDLEMAEAFLDTVAISCSNDIKNRKLRQILLNTGIPPDTIVINLGDDMLEAQQLVRPQWTRMGIRHQTNALYRQANYNLLREETEGYSKLVTELFTTVENEEPTDATAKNSFERVKAMIGAFNLDVGRALDVTMDVFAAILIKHSSFLVRFLYNSTWWPRDSVTGARHENDIDHGGLPAWIFPVDSLQRSDIANLRQRRDEMFWSRVKEADLKAFFEIGGRWVNPEKLDAIISTLSDDTELVKDKDGIAETKVTPTKSSILRKWIEETGTLPPPGNENVAQILGFKLRFYSSTVRDVNADLPCDLIYLVALLIKIGFISLLDIYPHLWPSDNEMGAVKKRLEKEKDERERDRKPGGKNALELAGALVDDTVPPPPRKLPEPVAKPVAKAANTTDGSGQAEKVAEETKKLADPAEQKILLLKSLLCIGAIPEALFILGQFPWMTDLVPELPEHINRILHQSLTLVYDRIRPLSDVVGLQEPEKYADPEQTSVQKGFVQLAPNSLRKSRKWANVDKIDSSDGIDYKFYWEDWTDNIPLCHNVDDVFLLCNTFLNLNSYKIGRDPLLIAMLARIGLHSLDTDSSESNKVRWIHLCKRLLVPALSLADRNSGSVAEVWNLLKRFPTSTRYNIYFEWYLGQTSRNNDIKNAFTYSQSETKDVLKKISKTNTRPMARLLAKVAVASPGKVFEVVIKQIESYDNLISVVVEASRYFTDLGYDVLTWSLINALGKARSRVQSDGMLTSRWLSKLAQFCGTVFKRYAVMNPIPVLQYVTNQLLSHNSTDLVVLEYLVSSMAGITQDATFNENQVIAMCGGPTLRANTMAALLDQRGDPNMKNSTKRLMKALAASHLTGALLVAICQERQSCIFDIDEADAHLKLLGNFFDEIHRVLTQYIDLLQTNLPDSDFKTIIPSMSALIGDFGIEASVAFWIWRPTIASGIAAHDKSIAEKPTAVEKSASKDVDMIDSDPTETGAESKISDARVDATQELEDTDMAGAQESSDSALTHPVIQELIDSIKPVLPQGIFEMISYTFYFTFWRLSPYDLHVPEVYQEESRRFTAKVEQLKNERGGTANDARNREAQRKQLTDQSLKIGAELKEHITVYQRTKVALNKEKSSWFQLSGGSWDDLNVAILEHCFIPRMTLSSIDSFFVFKMLKVLHSIGAKNFRTMALLDCFFNGKRLLPLFFACTAKEAENVGRFINEVLKDLNKWHSGKETYEKEAFGTKRDLPGFKKNLSIADSFLDYESFRTLYGKWHRMLHDALRESLKSSEYMHIRNAIIILKTVVQIFPAVEWMGRNLEEAVKVISIGEERGDLKLSAIALLGILRRRSSQWVAAQVFARHKPGQANGPPGSKAAASRAISPAPSKSPAPTPESNKVLNAKAPDFVPGALSIDPAKKRDTRGEAEDGEIRTPTTAKLPTPASANDPSARVADVAKVTPPTDDKTVPKLPPKAADKFNDRTPTQIPARPLPETKRQELPPRPESTSRLTYHNRQGDVPRNHNLPARVDISNNTSRVQDSRNHERPLGRGYSRDINDSRESDYRQNDRNHEPPRGAEPDRRSTSRAYDRSYHDERDHTDAGRGGDRSAAVRSYDDQRPSAHPAPPSRDEKTDRTLRDAPPMDSRERYRNDEAYEPASRDTSRVPRSGAPVSDRTSLLKTAQEQDRSQHAAYSDRRHDGPRSEHDHTPPSRGSRGSSPVRRGEDVTSRSDYKRYDDRAMSDNRRTTESASSRPRHDDSRSHHNSRSEYYPESGPAAHSDTSRDDQRGFHSSRQDTNSGWGLKAETRHPPRQQDSNYGRLNQESSGTRSIEPNSVPVAPRQTRQSNSQQDLSDHRNPTSSGSVSAPSGPASSRAPARSASSYARPAPISTAVPPTASSSSSPDTAGIHPDRLKALQGNSATNQSNSVQAPAGPRNAPNASHNTDNGRERTDKRFSQLNTVLSQNNGSPGPERPVPVPQVRGRGELDASSPTSNGPPSRNGPPPLDSGSRSDFNSTRPASALSRNEDNRRSQRVDDRQTRAQNSQLDSPRQRPQQGNPRDYPRPSASADSRDSRTRSGASHPQSPPIHQHQDRERRPMRENAQGSGERNSRRDGGREEWPDQRQGQRRDTQPDLGGSGRKRGRGNEENYDQSQVPYDHPKRPRRS